MKPCSSSCNCTIFHQETLNNVEKKLYSDESYEKISEMMKIIGDKSRMKILDSIKEDALCVCDLSYLLGISKSAISHQMKLLKSYDLVQSEKKGKMVYYLLKNQHVKAFINQGYHLTKGLTHD